MKLIEMEYKEILKKNLRSDIDETFNYVLDPFNLKSKYLYYQ